MSVVKLHTQWKRQFTRDEIVIYQKRVDADNVSDTICRIHFPMEGMTEANKLRALDKANLIVAAPDLLDSMNQILKHLEPYKSEEFINISPEIMLGMILQIAEQAVIDANGI